MKVKKVAMVFTYVDGLRRDEIMHDSIKDMLRYDGAFVCDAMPDVLVYPDIQDKDGTFKRKPELGRWASFRVTLTEVKDAKFHDIASHFMSHPRDWYTFRREGGIATNDVKKFTLQ